MFSLGVWVCIAGGTSWRQLHVPQLHVSNGYCIIYVYSLKFETETEICAFAGVCMEVVP